MLDILNDLLTTVKVKWLWTMLKTDFPRHIRACHIVPSNIFPYDSQSEILGDKKFFNFWFYGFQWKAVEHYFTKYSAVCVSILSSL